MPARRKLYRYLGAVLSKSTGDATPYLAIAEDDSQANYHVYKEHCALAGVEHKYNPDWQTKVERLLGIDPDGEYPRAWRISREEAAQALSHRQQR